MDYLFVNSLYFVIIKVIIIMIYNFYNKGWFKVDVLILEN